MKKYIAWFLENLYYLILTQLITGLYSNQDSIYFWNFLSGIVFETGHYSDQDSIPEYTVFTAKVNKQFDFINFL